MFREESAASSRREYSGEVVARQSTDRAAVEERGYSNAKVSRSIRLNFSQRFPSPMPVLCPTLPTGPLRMQTEQNVEDLCNSLRLKDISSFQGVVWFARVIGIRTLDLAILVRVQGLPAIGFSPLTFNRLTL